MRASGPLSSLPLSLLPGVAAAFREAMMTRALTDSLSPRATRQSHIPTPRGLGWASSGRGRGVCRQAGPRPATACRRERGPAPGGGPRAVRGSPGLARSTEQLLSPVARVTEGFFLLPLPFLVGYRELIMCQVLVTHFSQSSKQLCERALAATDSADAEMGSERVRHLLRVTQPASDARSGFRSRLPAPPMCPPHRLSPQHFLCEAGHRGGILGFVLGQRAPVGPAFRDER